ncbi:VOC family protein [Flavobacterium pallidum]|uniref:Lactoylglutathione lyase n=1 Tax=Flavobacterium pallidum TaxID=2172098 RepID=A0A2S1SK25_9FLAO|nr:VOC family protein [Flavobacterium pallidum]AWI26758.1 lactoylglutathione lyase [Flavobacterium pallidum]
MEKLSETTNALNWFEIPVTDVQRAKSFYEKLFEINMQPIEMMDMEMVLFPSKNPKSGGALVKSPNHKPSTEGSIIYLNGNPDLQIVLDRIETAGGKVAMPKTNINPDTGNMAFFIDTEGNMIGLHSVK